MKVFEKILNIAFAVFASITALNYTVYLIHLIIFPEQPLAFIITFTVLSLIALPVIFRRKLRALLKKAYPVFKALWTAAMAVYVVSFIIMTSVIIAGKGVDPSPSDIPEDTVLIVYGAKVGGSESSPHPGQFLRYRLDYAASIMEERPGTVCIVCGGRGDNEPAAEADVMRSYLISKGIDAERIFVDDESENTIENIDNAMRIMEERGLKGKSVACLSTEYHIPRIKYLCSKAGLDADYYFHAASPNFFGLWSGLVREYMSYGKLILTGHL
ncbi:MAG: YdcF family protein [Clostridia bacterium]|nr:YdcF family protein [Clostridia bacterium]